MNMKRITLLSIIAVVALMATGCGNGDGYPDKVGGPETCSEGEYQLYKVKVYGRNGAEDIALDCEAALRAIIESGS